MMQGSEESHEGSGRVAFVTGGGRGIGKAIAIGMARVGYRVVVASTTQANNEAAAEEIRAAGRQALALELDVGVEASVAQAVDHTLAEFGRIDVLVNNAGLKGGTFPPDRRHLTDVPLDRWRRMFAVNVEGPLMCVQRCVPAMLDVGAGSIINIGSGAAQRDEEGGGPYAASKAALQAFSRTLAAELRGARIAVNTIIPGNMQTERTDLSRLRPGQADRMLKTTAIVPLTLFLARQDDAQITGQTIGLLEWNMENGLGGREVWGLLA
jgi:NAD(P)-dependent dehydrogenase (short-subunit alcohol dehydrogenase family)